MYRNSILAAAVCGMGAFMAADTGAPMGGGAAVANAPAAQGNSPADSAGTPNQPAQAKVRKPAAPPVVLDSLEALKAHTVVDGHRKYQVKASDGALYFIATTNKDKAINVAATKAGYTAVNIDNPNGTPGRKPSKTIEEHLDAMAPEVRESILAKYLSPAQLAAIKGASAGNGGGSAPGNAGAAERNVAAGKPAAGKPAPVGAKR
jgi:hypothetical protein